MRAVSTVTKAVILAAGLGTRMLPATKAVPKELLPIVDRPLIEYAVSEALAAGITEVVFVIAPGKEAIRDHFSESTRADAFAAASGDAATVERVTGPARAARYHWAYQAEPRGIAHAIQCARDQLEGGPFALIFPDDLILGRSTVEELSIAHRQTGGTVIAVQEVPEAEVPQYGIVDPIGEGNPVRLRGVIEKPTLAEAPSRLAIVGRYILGETIFRHIDATPPGRNGEIQVTDAIARQIAAGEPVSGLRYSGRRFDTGRPLGYLVANIAAGLEREELAPGLRQALRAMLGA